MGQDQLMRRRMILNGEVNFPVSLAPMVGLSHVAMRKVVKSYLPAGAKTLWPTEMLNSRKLPYENLSRVPEAMRASDETHLVPQILGNEEQAIAQSVQRLEHEWGASGVDINMGCPVKKALSHNYGVALMGDARYAADVVRMTVRNTKLPVSVKLRAGHEGDIGFLTSFVQGLEEAGAAWITLHPRTAEQKRRGRADWSMIKTVRESTTMPVLGNGDVQTCHDVFRMLDETGCDMVVVGRALTARPWLLWQVGERLGLAEPLGREGERAPFTPSEEAAEYARSLKVIACENQNWFGEELGLRKFRFHIKNSSAWLKFGHDLYARSTKAKSFIEVQSMLEDFFQFEHEMLPSTELRQ